MMSDIYIANIIRVDVRVPIWTWFGYIQILSLRVRDLNFIRIFIITYFEYVKLK